MITTSSLAQTNTVPETLAAVSDSVIKNELRMFTRKGMAQLPAGGASSAKLIEIPVLHCSDTEVYLGTGGFFNPVSTHIHLYFKNSAGVKTLDSIFLVTHSHFWNRIPQEAYTGVFTTVGCTLQKQKRKTFRSDDYKAFYSADNRRIYIYLRGGKPDSPYEVTWIIANGKYYTRIMDALEL